MDAEQVLKLLDTYWFKTTIYSNKTYSPFHSAAAPTSPSLVVEVLPLDTKLLRAPTLQVRSFSDQNMGSKVSALSDYPSPNSVFTPQKLHPILSGKEMGDDQFPLDQKDPEEEAPTKKRLSQRTRLRKEKITRRSLSELELKELKGFMDLSFAFSEEDKDSGLVSLIPGLHRMGTDHGAGVGKEEQENIIAETVIGRPYLSEAWGVLDQRKVKNPLLSFRVPVEGNEVVMKDNLRFWAHTVASIVR